MRLIFLIRFLLVGSFTPSIVVAQSSIEELKEKSSRLPAGREKVMVLDSLSETFSLMRDNLDTALFFADSIRIVGKAAGMEKESFALSEKHYSVVNRHRGKYAQALEHINHYLEYFDQDSTSYHFMEGHYQVGAIHHLWGNYVKSLEAYQVAVQGFEQLGMPYHAAATLAGIGSIYKRQKRWEQAESTYKKALEIFKRIDDKNGIGVVLSNLGDISVGIGAFEKAEDYYRQTLAISEELGQDWHIADDYDDLGDLYSLQGKPLAALTEYFKALLLRRKIANSMSTSQTLRNIGSAYIQSGQHRQAEKYLLEGLELAKKAEAYPVMMDLYRYLSETSAAKKHFEKAFRYHSSYAAIKDSVMGKDVAKQLNELQIRYETSEKDGQISLLAKETALKEEELARQKTVQRFYAFALFTALLTGFMIYYFYRQRLKTQRMIAEKNEELSREKYRNELRDLELKALRAQINPHFIFNCMNSINLLILSGNNDDASRYLGKLSKLIRHILENSETTEVILSNELNLMKAYIDLEQLRFKNSIDYKCTIAPELNPDDISIPSMILQPFIENAIWHGLANKSNNEQGKIRLSIDFADESLIFVIEDNGVGREYASKLKRQTIVKQSSMGLKITEERLRLISQNNLDPVIRFEDLRKEDGTAAGTRVVIELANYPDLAA